MTAILDRFRSDGNRNPHMLQETTTIAAETIRRGHHLDYYPYETSELQQLLVKHVILAAWCALKTGKNNIDDKVWKELDLDLRIGS